MGYELLTQPQVFTVKISALGGIEGYAPPYISSFYTWTITATANSTVFNILNGPGLNHVPDSSYIVNISGSIIPPPDYYVNPDFRTITFNRVISAGTTFNLTQIGTVALSTANYFELTGYNFFSQNLTAINARVTNLTAGNLTVTNKVPLLNVSTLSSDRIIVDVDTSNDAVRITQRGTGNILIAEDSPNPDATPFAINHLGQIISGAVSAFDANAGLQITSDSSTAPNATVVISRSNNTNNAALTIRRSRGILAARQGVECSTPGSGDSFGALIFSGYNGTLQDYLIGARILSRCDAAPGAADMPGNLIFSTGIPGITATPGTGNSIAERMRINSAGNIGIGTTAPTQRLHVQDGRILQTTSSSTPPIIQQNFTNQYIDSTTRFDVQDPLYSTYLTEQRSHTIEFRRTVPTRPVNYWIVNSETSQNTFTLTGGPNLYPQSQAYIVTVGGLIQPSTRYAINTTTRELSFSSPVPASTDVYVVLTLNPALSAAYSSTVTQMVTSSTIPATTYPLSGLAAPLRDTLGQYVVGVDGVYQIPNNPPYTVSTAASTITFATSVPANLPVTVTRVPSAVSFSGPAQDACFLGTFFTWVTSVSTNVSQLSLASGPANLLSDKNSYLVNIGGVLQTPVTYDINPRTRVIVFNTAIPGSNINPINVAVTQLAAPEIPIKYNTVLGLIDECYTDSNGLMDEVVNITPGQLTVLGGVGTMPPVTVTATTYTVPFTATSIIFNTTGPCGVTLPTASRYPGRWLYLKTTSSTTFNNNISSVSVNVVPLSGGTANRILLPQTGTAAAAKWASLQSDGSNWIVMAAN